MKHIFFLNSFDLELVEAPNMTYEQLTIFEHLIVLEGSLCNKALWNYGCGLCTLTAS